MNHLKRLGGHYLALILLLVLLILTLTWFYQYIRLHFGSEIALVALALILTGELILMTRGAVYTSRIHRKLREQADNPAAAAFPEEKRRPMLFKIFDMDLRPIAIAVPEKTEMSKVRLEIQKLLDTPKKRKGKQPRFPLAEIRAAVLEWEQRDSSFSVETLEDFLGRKFGYGTDGILLMSVSTFYDWRRRTLQELDPHRPPSDKAKHVSHLSPSELSSRTLESSS
ncbi:hypothetical protein DIM_11550 [Candidatus Denitrolinea symbiosum]|nr:hypothetical protein [Chloroflexi bacterium CFX2]GER79074.1 hypothetical protein DIM_11550 [Candidatus Denitrolinea symbiosum]HPO85080.1 hypothetical protein [Candidatus Hydrogenedentota bacterium]